MKIYNKVLNEILNHISPEPPETGGIIGGKEGIICCWEYDMGYSEEACAYRPNVNLLNEVIAVWINKGYDFMGILHVHFGGSKLLSNGDKRYIEKIMKAMPSSIERLYFPIVLQPEKQVVSYVAYKNSMGEVLIVEDEIEIF